MGAQTSSRAGWTERAAPGRDRRGPSEVHEIAEARNAANFGVTKAGSLARIP